MRTRSGEVVPWTKLRSMQFQRGGVILDIEDGGGSRSASLRCSLVSARALEEAWYEQQLGSVARDGAHRVVPKVLGGHGAAALYGIGLVAALALVGWIARWVVREPGVIVEAHAGLPAGEHTGFAITLAVCALVVASIPALPAIALVAQLRALRHAERWSRLTLRPSGLTRVDADGRTEEIGWAAVRCVGESFYCGDVELRPELLSGGQLTFDLLFVMSQHQPARSSWLVRWRLPLLATAVALALVLSGWPSRGGSIGAAGMVLALGLSLRALGAQVRWRISREATAIHRRFAVLAERLGWFEVDEAHRRLTAGGISR